MLRLCAARRAFAVIRGRSRAPLPPPHPHPPHTLPRTLPPSPHASPAARQSPRARAAAGDLQARDRVCPFLGITGVIRMLWLIHPVNCVRPAYSPGTRLERDGRAARGGPLHLACLWHLCHPRSSSTMTDTLFSSLFLFPFTDKDCSRRRTPCKRLWKWPSGSTLTRTWTTTSGRYTFSPSLSLSSTHTPHSPSSPLPSSQVLVQTRMAFEAKFPSGMSPSDVLTEVGRHERSPLPRPLLTICPLPPAARPGPKTQRTTGYPPPSGHQRGTRDIEPLAAVQRH